MIHREVVKEELEEIVTDIWDRLKSTRTGKQVAPFLILLIHVPFNQTKLLFFLEMGIIVEALKERDITSNDEPEEMELDQPVTSVPSPTTTTIPAASSLSIETIEQPEQPIQSIPTRKKTDKGKERATSPPTLITPGMFNRPNELQLTHVTPTTIINNYLTKHAIPPNNIHPDANSTPLNPSAPFLNYKEFCEWVQDLARKNIGNNQCKVLVSFHYFFFSYNNYALYPNSFFLFIN